VFAAAAVVMAGFGLWLARQPLAAPAANGHTPWSAIRATVRDRRVLRLGVLLLLWDTVEVPFLGLVASSLVETHGYGEGTAALAVGTWTLGATLAFALLTVRPRRGEATMRRAAALRVVCVLVIAASGAPAVVVPASFALGVSGAGFWVPYQSAVLRLRPDQRGTTWAVIACISLVGLAAPPLFGVLADRHGPQAAILATAALPALVLTLLSRPAVRRLRAWSSSPR
jgi:fucose permease